MSQNSSSFFSFVYTDLTGKKATEDIDHFLNELCKLFVNFEENHIEPPSSCVLALTANCGASFPHAAASALNCITDKHLLFSRISEFVKENWEKDPDLVAKTFKLNKLKIPGFGHPSIRGGDDRVLEIIALANKLSIDCPRLLFMESLSKSLKPCLNIGGATSAVLLDLGFNNNSVVYFPLISRLFGWLQIYLKLEDYRDPLLPSHVFLEKYKKIFSKE
jgi:hypothetical protein